MGQRSGSHNRHGIKSYNHQAIKGQEVIDPEHAKNTARANSNNVMSMMLDAVEQPTAIAPQLRVARIAAQSLQPNVLEAFDTDAKCFQSIRDSIPAEPNPDNEAKALQLDAQAMQLAKSYLAWLGGSGARDSVLTEMIKLHRDLIQHSNADTHTSDAEQAVHEILNGVVYVVKQALAEPQIAQRSR